MEAPSPIELYRTYEMLQTRRSAVRVAQRLRNRQQLRFDSSVTSSGHAASAGKAEPTHHGHHPEPVNESLGVRPYSAIGQFNVMLNGC